MVSFSALGAIAKKEFVGIFRERTILLAIVIQVFVAAFSSFLVVGLSALVDPSAIPDYTEPVVATNGTSRAAEVLAAEGLDVRYYDSDENARAAFTQGAADALMLVRGPLDENGTFDVELVLPESDMLATLTLTQVKNALEVYEKELREERDGRLVQEPLYVEGDIAAGQFSFVYALLIPLLVFLPVIISGGLSADSLTEEVQRGTLPLLLVTPANATQVVEGKILANTAITPLLVVAWFGLLALNGFSIPWSGLFFITVLATALAWIGGILAAAIALAVRDRDRAQVLFALAFFLVLGLAMLLPVSPVNAVTLLAADSVHRGVHLVVLGSLVASLVGWGLLRSALRRAGRWMAAGES
ncbi:MAG: ABC transporter permease [Euryarchaeota archaeon]|nr:ABC transporter permease [Euryarchaeota archaeon]